MTVWGMVADDLTGAVDAAAGFSAMGLPAIVACEGIDTPLDEGVTVVVTGARAWDPELSTAATQTAVETLVRGGAERLFVKIDSTARGSTRYQILGALTGWSAREPDAAAVICPAFPALGRVVRGACVFVHDVPLALSPASSDAVTPVDESDLRAILDARPVRVGDTVRPGERVVLDAQTDEDLDDVAATILAAGPSAIAVGSGGLAAALGRAEPATWPASTDSQRVDGPIMVAVSSRHPRALAQLDALSSAASDVRVFTTSREWTAPAVAAQELAARVAVAVEATRPAALVLVGGDGASRILHALGARRLRVRGALTPGSGLSTIEGGIVSGVPVVTKSGGFGPDDELLTLVERLRRPRFSSTLLEPKDPS
ncbi:four-carbon acid sugar kinase family protein [Microbacterium sp. RG1]|uniref:four-carbon acid sugar kinase family protein n=1 Tax=Microbacterium sp. RG1 TaxID=2489212 RepID=UPI001375E73D|nr:four-carbon acid sugar kinase family protein [Microbacterium sp. RG1]